MEKFTQNLLRISLSSLCLTLPISSLFIVFEYLGYKKSITNFAQGELGDIVYVEIETLNESVKMGDVFGTIEAVKTVSDLFIPVSGKVLEFNSALEDNPELVNESPYEEGWIVRMEISNLHEISDLLDSKAYKSLIGQ